MPSPSPREARLAHQDPLGRPGPGTLQWSRGGFFGSQLGMTLWMLLAGGLLATSDLARGLSVVGLFLAANAVGLVLWSARARLAPHAAIQLLALTGLAAAVGTMALIGASELGDAVAAELGTGRPLWGYLGVFPLLMVGLWWLDRRGREPRT